MPTDPDLTPVFARIDVARDTALQRLIDYVSRPSISAHGAGIAEVAGYIAAQMQRIGLDTQLLPAPGWPVVLGRRHPVPGAPTVLLYGHYDVQPPDPLDLWVSPPFEPAVRDGRLFGRGVADNKGQHLANLLAIEALIAVNGELPCNVTVLLEGEEEIGSPHLAEIVDTHRDLLKADLVITSDGPVVESGRASIMFGVRGVLSFELRARGAKSDLHSGNWGGIAPNPLWTLVHLLASMKDERGTVTVDGFYDDVLPLTERERDALTAMGMERDAVMRTLGVSRLDEPQERDVAERLSAWPTFTINGLHGGYGGAGSKTVLPGEAIAKCDVRLVEAQRASDIFAKIERHVAQHAPEVEVVYQGSMDPSKTPIDSPYAAPLAQAVKLGRGEEPLLVPALGGSLPEYVWTRILGVPSFVVPYGNTDEANHAPNENLELDRFFDGIKTGAAMLTLIGQMAGDPSPAPSR